MACVGVLYCSTDQRRADDTAAAAAV